MIVTSKFPLPPVQVPFHETILKKCLEHHANRPEKKAFIRSEDGFEIGFDELHKYAHSLGAWLVSNGFRKGDVILLFIHNSWEFVVGCLGAWVAGLTVSPASPQFSQYELQYQLEDCGASLILTDEACLPVVNTVLAKNPMPVICTSPMPGTVDFGAILKMKPLPEPVKVDMHNDLLLLPYSSGTTGAPKGVMITYHNYASILDSHNLKYRMIFQERGFDDFVPQEEAVTFLPLYHAMGLFGMFFHVSNGTTQIMMAKFNLETFIKHLADYEVVVTTVVPSILIQMVHSPLLDKYDLSSLMGIGVGSAPLSNSIVEKINKRLPNATISQGYGMTETSVATHISHPDAPLGTIGQLLPGTEMKVISEDGKLCGPGEEGELWLRGPQIMRGYWRKPKETAEAFDKDGFMRTGDVVYYDEDGYTFICDRIKELIKCNEKQVAPAELESIILEVPGVTDCCVVGLRDEKYGEVPQAFVVCSHKNGQAIQDHVNAKVAPYKRLRGGVVFVEALPRTPTGKLLRRQLKKHATSKL